MAQDQFGNYVADFTRNDVFVDPTNAGGAGVAGGSSSASQIYTFDYADPNVAGLVPDDPTKGAKFNQDPSITVFNQWDWSVDSQVWIQTSSP